MAPTEAEKEPQEKGKNKSVKEDEVDEAAAQERFSPEEEAVRLPFASYAVSFVSL